MMAYAFYDDEDVLVAGEQSGADQTQEDGGTIPVTSAAVGDGDVGAEDANRRGAADFLRDELELPAQNIVT